MRIFPPERRPHFVMLPEREKICAEYDDDYDWDLLEDSEDISSEK
jgi:hypothetical protein